MSEELKRCAFCKGEAYIEMYSGGGKDDCHYYVYCTDCKVSLGGFDNEEEAIKAWNQREPKLERLSEEKVNDIILEKDMEWYPYKDRLLPQKQSKLLAKAITSRFGVKKVSLEEIEEKILITLHDIRVPKFKQLAIVIHKLYEGET